MMRGKAVPYGSQKNRVFVWNFLSCFIIIKVAFYFGNNLINKVIRPKMILKKTACSEIYVFNDRVCAYNGKSEFTSLVKF